MRAEFDKHQPWPAACLCKWSFIRTQPCSLICLFMAAFTLQGQSQVSETETFWLAKVKIFEIWPFSGGGEKLPATNLECQGWPHWKENSLVKPEIMSKKQPGLSMGAWEWREQDSRKYKVYMQRPWGLKEPGESEDLKKWCAWLKCKRVENMGDESREGEDGSGERSHRALLATLNVLVLSSM